MILLCSAFVNAQRGGIAVRRVLINFLVTGIARSRGIVARHKKAQRRPESTNLTVV